MPVSGCVVSVLARLFVCLCASADEKAQKEKRRKQNHSKRVPTTNETSSNSSGSSGSLSISERKRQSQTASSLIQLDTARGAVGMVSLIKHSHGRCSLVYLFRKP